MSDNDIIKYYEDGHSIASTARYCGLSNYKTKQFLLSRGIRIRSKHEQNIIENVRRAKKVDHNYFSSLDNERAYYLGFLAADGTVRSDCNAIKIGLSSLDRDFLEEFRERIQSEREIKDYITSKGFSVSELSFSSLKIKEDLSKYSIVPNKTYIGITMKNIPEEYKIPFIKGFFDGDGSFSFNKKTKQCKVVFTSHTKGILEEISQVFGNEGHIYKKNQSDFELDFSTIPSLDIMRKFYEIDTPCLLRKKQKYEECCKMRIQNNPRAKGSL